MMSKVLSSELCCTGTGLVMICQSSENLYLQEILERTGYSFDVTTGQRKYGGPPPGWDGPQPGAGHEVSLDQLLFLS